jgi:hypothetical protein
MQRLTVASSWDISMIDCPCGRYKIDEKAQLCPYCGIVLKPKEHAATRALADTDFEEGVPRWGTARFSSRMNLMLRVRDTNQSFTFDAATVTELVIGRKDPDTGLSPDVDLHASGAPDKGVSRKHALIIRKDEGSLSIVDKGSPNGTYLNGQKLIPNQPRVLRDGDELRLGHLVLTVRFERL